MAAVKRRKLDDGSFNGFDSDSDSSIAVENHGLSRVSQEQPTAAVSKTHSTEEATPAGKTFQELGIMDSLCDACTELGFKRPTPIQEESIPLALQGRDLIGLAETGSGKTAAFALPILQALMERPQPLFGLVLAPTRELAIQTSQQFSALGSLIAVRVATIVGGVAEMDQAIALSKQPHIVVATPGRLLWHLTNTKGFSLRNLKYLVLDEADRLLEMSFGDEIDKILKVLPQRHTYLFSATMGSGVESLQRASLRNPARVSVSNRSSTSTSKHKTVATLVQHWLLVPQKRKDLYLVYLMTGVFSGHSAIIFARTVNEVARLTYLLRALGVTAVVPLHGQMSQSSRLSSLSKFKSKGADILVATDVAARGLDIPSVDLVMNFDLPGDSTTYIHRVGRTARAGKSGRAISIVTQYDIEVWLRIEKTLGHEVDQYQGADDNEVRILGERVGEAQRVAIKHLKDDASKKGGSSRGEIRRGKRTKDDREER